MPSTALVKGRWAASKTPLLQEKLRQFCATGSTRRKFMASIVTPRASAGLPMNRHAFSVMWGPGERRSKILSAS
jgi:hypothetical protein